MKKKLFLSFIILFALYANVPNASAQSFIGSPTGSYVSSATVTVPGATITSSPVSASQPDAVEPWWVALLTAIINIIVGLIVRKQEKSFIRRKLHKRIDFLAKVGNLSDEQANALKLMASQELDRKYKS